MTTSLSYIIWGLSVLLGSSSSILTRYASGMPASSIGFWRVAGAALLLAPWTLRVWLREGRPRLFTPGVLAMFLLKYVKSQMATLSIPTQFIIGTVLAMFLFGEKPRPGFWFGAVLVLAGVVLGILPTAEKADEK